VKRGGRWGKGKRKESKAKGKDQGVYEIGEVTIVVTRAIKNSKNLVLLFYIRYVYSHEQLKPMLEVCFENMHKEGQLPKIG